MLIMADERIPTLFIYCGKRLTTKNALAPAWVPAGAALEFGRDPDELRLYGKLKGTVIGGIYTLDFADNGTSYFPASLAYTGERLDADDRLALEARDKADTERHAGLALEKNHARTSDLKDLCAPLRELVGRQVGWSNRAALLSYITTEIGRG